MSTNGLYGAFAQGSDEIRVGLIGCGGRGTGAAAFDQSALKRKEISPYVQEHTDFIASIRKGEPISELKFTTESTASAIMGREAAYTGKVVTFDDIVNSTTVLAPPTVDLKAALSTPPVPMPGGTTN